MASIFLSIVFIVLAFPSSGVALKVVQARRPQEGVLFRFLVASRVSYQKALQIQFEVFFVRSRKGVNRNAFFLDLSGPGEVWVKCPQEAVSFRFEVASQGS